MLAFTLRRLRHNARDGLPLPGWMRRRMQLQMKSRCARCQASLLADGLAYICSYECTFCSACAVESQGRCPNCAGELVLRPRRIGGAANAERTDADRTKSSQWRIWVASFGVWALVALAGSGESYEWWRSRGDHMTFASVFGLQLSQILTYAPLTPLVFALVM